MNPERIFKYMPHLVLGAFFCIALSGCGKRSTPPGPSSIFGFVEPNLHFQFLLWDEDLVILLLDNFTKGHHSSGKGSTRDPVHRQTGSALSEEGDTYDWKIETVDGISAKVEINGEGYDIGKGAVFVVTVNEKVIKVDQSDLDLSSLSNVEDCRNFIKVNREALIKLAE